MGSGNSKNKEDAKKQANAKVELSRSGSKASVAAKKEQQDSQKTKKLTKKDAPKLVISKSFSKYEVEQMGSKKSSSGSAKDGKQRHGSCAAHLSEDYKRTLRHAHSETEMSDVTKLIWEMEYQEKVQEVKKHHKEIRDKEEAANGKNKGVRRNRSVSKPGEVGNLAFASYVSAMDCLNINPDEIKPDFNGVQDAEMIRKCVKSKKYKDLLSLVGTKNCIERCVIAKKYKHLYGQDITALFRSELVGDFRILMEGLFIPVIDFLTTCLRRAMKGFGTNEKTIINILVPCNNDDIRQLKECYLIKYGRDLEKDIHNETSGYFRRTLVSLMQGAREPCIDESGKTKEVDPNKAKTDAETLYEVGEGRWGTDESVFNSIMCNRSWTELKAIFEEYSNLSKRDIYKAIKSEFSGDIQDTHIG